MIQLRKMQSRDRQTIYEILQQTDMFTATEIEVAMELIDTFLFNTDQKDYIIQIAKTEPNEVIGYVCFGPTPATDGTYDLYWIVVSPAFQNQGVGKILLKFVENHIRGKNGRMIIIETSSQEKYFPTRNFYLRNSYYIAAQIKDFYRFGDDKIIFVKNLSKTLEDNIKNGTMAKNFEKKYNEY